MYTLTLAYLLILWYILLMSNQEKQTDLLESPSEKLFPITADTDVFSKTTHDIEMVENDFDGFMAQAQNLLNEGKYKEAMDKYDTVYWLVDKSESRKIELLYYKMADTLQRWADSEIEDDKVSLKMLKDADIWNNFSEKYAKKAQEEEEKAKFLNNPDSFIREAQDLLDAGKFADAFKKYEIAQMKLKMAETLLLWAESGVENDETTLKMLEKSEAILNSIKQENP
jgi:tetratricopeptide (TPR) repeat protein